MTVADIASVVAAVGSLSALGASIYAVVYQTRAAEDLERQRWLREHLLEDIVRVENIVAGLEIGNLCNLEPVDGERERDELYRRAAHFMITQNFDKHATRLMVLGPKKLAEATACLDKASMAYIWSLIGLEPPPEGREPNRQKRDALFRKRAAELKDKENAFLITGRETLGIDSEPVSLEHGYSPTREAFDALA